MRMSIKTLIWCLNKFDVAGMMETIEEYLRSCGGVVRAPLAYFIRKTIIVQFYVDYTVYATLDDEMITKILHLPPEKNKLLSELNVQLVRADTEEYKINNRGVYDILDQICKDTDLYPCVKQHTSKRDGRGAFYAIHS